jgi:hypothetical protein
MKVTYAFIVMTMMSMWLAACGATGGGSASTSQSSRTPSHATSTASAATKPIENDDYISTYGHEAAGAERQKIIALVKRYYSDVVAGNGAAACSLLSPSLARAVPEDYGQAPGPPALRGKTCATVLSKLSSNVSGQPAAVLAATKITGVRLRGGQGFVQLSSSAMPTGELAVERRAGSWRVEVLIGRACANCAAS